MEEVDSIENLEQLFAPIGRTRPPRPAACSHQAFTGHVGRRTRHIFEQFRGPGAGVAFAGQHDQHYRYHQGEDARRDD